jgi:hypothetical protein
MNPVTKIAGMSELEKLWRSALCSAIFPDIKKSSGMHSDTKFGLRRGGVSYTDTREKGSGSPFRFES